MEPKIDYITGGDLRPKQTGVEIPDFLSTRMDRETVDIDLTKEITKGINDALEEGKSIRKDNLFHMKELDKIAEAYTEDEAKVIVKRLVSNYPDVVLGEVASLIKDMQELSGSILKNSKIFASKRGEI